MQRAAAGLHRDIVGRKEPGFAPGFFVSFSTTVAVATRFFASTVERKNCDSSRQL
jgi:hypothetical protein